MLREGRSEPESFWGLNLGVWGRPRLCCYGPAQTNSHVCRLVPTSAVLLHRQGWHVCGGMKGLVPGCGADPNPRTKYLVAVVSTTARPGPFLG